LVVAVAKRGMRECLACNRAGAYIRMKQGKCEDVPDLKILSDEYFRSLVPMGKLKGTKNV
jgi:hypothetical protein